MNNVSITAASSVERWAARVIQEKGLLEYLSAEVGTAPDSDELKVALAIAAGATYRYEDSKITTEPVGIAWDGDKWLVHLVAQPFSINEREGEGGRGMAVERG